MVKTGDKSENRQHDAHEKEHYRIKKKNEEKNIFHISWKNHNVRKYIKDSMQEYLKIQEKRN